MSGIVLQSRLILKQKIRFQQRSIIQITKKACQESDVLVKTIKDNIDIFSEFIFHNFNNLLFDATFSSELKNANVYPVFNKKHQNKVENCRPVRILPNLSKMYKRFLCDQMVDISIIYSQNGNVDSIKALSQNTLFL